MPEGLPSLPEDTRTALDELPPSAKLVSLVLAQESELTQQQLVDETMLSSRTARHALSELEEAGVVDSRTSFMDARKSLYTLADTTEDGSGDDSMPLPE